jgi:hypothetical protein
MKYIEQAVPDLRREAVLHLGTIFMATRRYWRETNSGSLEPSKDWDWNADRGTVKVYNGQEKIFCGARHGG